jgi:uncharacterized protein
MSDDYMDQLRRGYEALNRGDLSAVLELLDPKIEWHEPAPSPDAGSHRGRGSFERFVRGWIESFDDFRIEPEQVVERNGRLIVVVRQRGKGRTSGAEVEARLAHLWNIKAGKAVRWEAMADVDKALADA